MSEMLTALISIIIIDLVLAGDNAIVIGMAARNLPKNLQKKAIIWGAVGAIVIRALATMGVVYLLKIPGLLLGGGLILIWIAYKLLIEEKGQKVKEGEGLWGAIRTIIIADAVMGLDNVLAVAGAAQGSYVLVVIGLIISIPLVIWGSTIILKFIERYPVIILIGSAVLAWTASKMVAAEPFLSGIFSEAWFQYGFEVLVVLAVLTAGVIKKRKVALKEQTNG